MTRAELVMSLFTGIVAVTGIIALFVYHWQGSLMDRQLNVMQGQLAAMEAEQRPWITFTPTGVRTLQFTTEGAQIPLYFKLKNIGHSPATKVWVDFKFFALATNRYPAGEQRALCDSMRAKETPPPTLSRTLFPDEEITLGRTIQTVKSEFEEAAKSNPQKSVGLYVVGCVDYRFGSAGRHHQTPFVFEITKINPPGAISASGGDIPAEQLSIESTYPMVDTAPD